MTESIVKSAAGGAAGADGEVEADADAVDLGDAAVGGGGAGLGPDDAVLLAGRRVARHRDVTAAVTLPAGGDVGRAGRTEVHVDSSLGVWPAAPRNAPFAIVAAAG